MDAPNARCDGHQHRPERELVCVEATMYDRSGDKGIGSFGTPNVRRNEMGNQIEGYTNGLNVARLITSSCRVAFLLELRKFPVEQRSVHSQTNRKFVKGNYLKNTSIGNETKNFTRTIFATSTSVSASIGNLLFGRAIQLIIIANHDFNNRGKSGIFGT
jgi:hypothetical protein